MDTNTLYTYGLTPRFAQEATLYEGLSLGRVCSQSRELYRVVTAQGELLAEVSGKLRYAASDAGDFPVVGDFVMLDRENSTGGNAIIHQILTRKSLIARRAAGTGEELQPVAANVDLLFICMAFGGDYNLRRLERYLAMAWDSRATPVVLLMKADLADDLPARMAETMAAAPAVEVFAVSRAAGYDLTPVRSLITQGKTVAFVGSSGVGKSTLINILCGRELLATGAVRADDDKGRHTTTRRELLPLPEGGVVIDTPGMRELGLEGADVSRAFADIDELASHCRFSDCSHGSEPGCAVRAAIENGALPAERLENYRKLRQEARYEGMTSRQRQDEKLTAMLEDYGARGSKKAARKIMKEVSERSKRKLR